MALNGSGPISLGGSTSGQSVNLELGQSATAQISFNDANVRTLTGTSANTALIMPTNFYGKSYALDTQTVTVGTYSVKGIVYYGYLSATSTGSIVDGTFNPLSGATITGLYYNVSGALVYFTLSGVYANSGWTSVNIAGTSFNRSAATFSNSSNTQWYWSSASNPFGTTVGATKVCTFS